LGLGRSGLLDGSVSGWRVCEEGEGYGQATERFEGSEYFVLLGSGEAGRLGISWSGRGVDWSAIGVVGVECSGEDWNGELRGEGRVGFAFQSAQSAGPLHLLFYQSTSPP
jgi:hypothetical protein